MSDSVKSFLVKFTGDFSSLEAGLKNLQIKLEKVGEQHIRFKFDNISDFNKQIQQAVKEGQKIPVTLQYQINDAALKEEQEKLNSMKSSTAGVLDDINTDKVKAKVQEMVQSIRDAFNSNDLVAAVDKYKELLDYKAKVTAAGGDDIYKKSWEKGVSTYVKNSPDIQNYKPNIGTVYSADDIKKQEQNVQELLDLQSKLEAQGGKTVQAGESAGSIISDQIENVIQKIDDLISSVGKASDSMAKLGSSIGESFGNSEALSTSAVLLKSINTVLSQINDNVNKIDWDKFNNLNFTQTVSEASGSVKNVTSEVENLDEKINNVVTDINKAGTATKNVNFAGVVIDDSGLKLDKRSKTTDKDDNVLGEQFNYSGKNSNGNKMSKVVNVVHGKDDDGNDVVSIASQTYTENLSATQKELNSNIQALTKSYDAWINKKLELAKVSVQESNSYKQVEREAQSLKNTVDKNVAKIQEFDNNHQTNTYGNLRNSTLSVKDNEYSQRLKEIQLENQKEYELRKAKTEASKQSEVSSDEKQVAKDADNLLKVYKQILDVKQKINNTNSDAERLKLQTDTSSLQKQFLQYSSSIKGYDSKYGTSKYSEAVSAMYPYGTAYRQKTAESAEQDYIKYYQAYKNSQLKAQSAISGKTPKLGDKEYYDNESAKMKSMADAAESTAKKIRESLGDNGISASAKKQIDEIDAEYSAKLNSIKKNAESLGNNLVGVSNRQIAAITELNDARQKLKNQNLIPQADEKASSIIDSQVEAYQKLQNVTLKYGDDTEEAQRALAEYNNTLKENKRLMNDISRSSTTNPYLKTNKYGENVGSGTIHSTSEADTYIHSGTSTKTKLESDWTPVSGNTDLLQKTVKLSADLNGNYKTLTYTYSQAAQSLHVLSSAGKDSLSITDKLALGWKRLIEYAGRFIGVYQVVQTAVAAVKQGYQYIVEYNSALTELQLVTGKSQSSMQSFAKSAQGVADAVGSTTTEVIKSSTEWARLGYSMDDSLKLAAESAKLAKAGFMDVSDATEQMTSSIQAFYGADINKGLISAGDAAKNVSDILVKLGNTMPITSQGLGEGLERSAGTLVASGSTIQEAAALISAANATMQDPDSIGNGLKTVAMRLRGTSVSDISNAVGEDMSGEFKDAAENASKLYDIIKKLTAVKSNDFKGVSILTDTGSYKSPYKILSEIASAWKEMTDVNQAALLEQIAGKRQGSIVASIFNNPDLLEKGYKNAQDAAGATDQAMEVAMSSIENKTKQLQNAWQTMWQNMGSSKLITNVIALLTDLVKIIDKLISVTNKFGVLIPSATIFGAFKYKDILRVASAIKDKLIPAITAYVAARKAALSSDQIANLNNIEKEASTPKSIVGMVTGNASSNAARIEKVASSEVSIAKIAKSKNIGTELASKASNAGKGADIGSAILSGVESAGIMLAVSAAITAIYTVWEKYQNRLDDRIQKSKEEITEYSNNISDIQKNLETIDSVKDEFSSLASGVDENGNNVSLTADQYKRYKDIVSQIIEMNPSLAKGYSEENGYLVDKNNLLDQAINLQKELNREENKKRAGQSKDIIGGALAEYTKNRNKLRDSMNQIGNVNAKTLEVASYAVESPLYSEYTNSAYGKNAKDRSSFYNYIKNNVSGLKNKDVNSDTFFNDNIDQIVKVSGALSNKMISAQGLDKEFNKYKEEFSDMASSYSDFSDATEEVNKQIADQLNVIAQSTDGYDKLSSQQQNVINKISESYGKVENISKEDKVNGDYNVDSKKYKDVENQVENAVKALSSDTAQKIFKNASDISKDVPISDYNKAVDGFVNQLKDVLKGQKIDVGTLKVACNLVPTDEDGNEVSAELMEKTINSVISSGSFDYSNMTQKQLESFYDTATAIKDSGDSASYTASQFENLALKNERLAKINDTVHKSFADVATEVTNYMSAASSLNDILFNNQSITEDQYNQIMSMVGADTDLSDAIDTVTDSSGKNTSYIIRNADAIRDAIDAAGDNSKAMQDLNDSLSDVEAQYADLVGQIDDIVGSQNELTDASDATLQSLFDQTDAVQDQIGQYTKLKGELLGVCDAYSKYTNAVSSEGSNHEYTDSLTKMLQEVSDDLYKNQNIGDESFHIAANTIMGDKYWDKRQKGANDAFAALKKQFTILRKKGLITYDKDASASADTPQIKQLDSKNAEAFKKLMLNTDVNGLKPGQKGYDKNKTFLIGTPDNVQVNEEFVKSLGDGTKAIESFADAWGKITGLSGDDLTNLVTPYLELLSRNGLEGQDIFALLFNVDKGEQALKMLDRLNEASQNLYSMNKANDEAKQSNKSPVYSQKQIDDATKEKEAASKDVREYGKQVRTEALPKYDATQELDKEQAKLEQLKSEYQDLQKQRDEYRGDSFGAKDISDQIGVVANDIATSEQKINILKEKIGDLPSEVDIKIAVKSIDDDLGILTKLRDANGDAKAAAVKVPVELQAEFGLKEKNGKYDVGDIDNAIQNLEEQKYKMNIEFSMNKNDVEDSYDKLQSIKDLRDDITDKSKNKMELDFSNYDSIIKSFDTIESRVKEIKSLMDSDISPSSKLQKQVDDFANAEKKSSPTGSNSGGSSKKAGKHAADGGTFKSGGKTLVGEEGNEIVVDRHKGVYQTVGDNGPEFVNLPKDAIVFNHQQTKELLTNGRTSTRGKSYANGNVKRADYSKYEYLNSLSKEQLLGLLDDDTADAKANGYEKYLKQRKFGNIDVSNRQALNWNKKNKEKYKDTDYVPDGDNVYSNVLGSDIEIGDYDIAYSPLLQDYSQSEPTILDDETIIEYFEELMNRAGARYGVGKWGESQFLALDHAGVTWDVGNLNGKLIHDLCSSIAKIGDEEGQKKADTYADAMHYAALYWDTQNVLNEKYGKKKGKTKADGGISQGNKTLVGELGQELVVNPNTGKYYTVGDNGAEFADLPKDSIVFNSKQTKELLRNGKIDSRGFALANGNAREIEDTISGGNNNHYATSSVDASGGTVEVKSQIEAEKAAKAAARAAKKAAKTAARAAKKAAKEWSDAFTRTAKELKSQLDTGKIDQKTYFSNLEKLYTNYYNKYGKKSKDNMDKLKSLWTGLYSSYTSDLNSKHSNGQIGTKQYLDSLQKAYKAFYKNVKGYANELKDAQLDYAKEMKSALESAISAGASVVGLRVDALQSQSDSAVKSLEKQQTKADRGYDKQIKSIEKRIQHYNDLIDSVQEEEEAIEDEISALQKEEKPWQKKITANEKLIKQNDKIIKGYTKQINAIQKNIDSDQDEIDANQKIIDKINDENSAREAAINLQKAQYELNRAENQRTQYTFTSDKGFVYRSNATDVRDARNDLDEQKSQKQIKDIENINKPIQERIDKLNEQIKAIQKQSDAVQEQSDAIQEQSDTYQENIDAIEERISALNEEKEPLEEIIKQYNKKINALNKQKDGIQRLKDAEDEYYSNAITQTEELYQKQIDALTPIQKKWEDFQKVVTLQEALQHLNAFGITAQDVFNNTDGCLDKLMNKYEQTVYAINKDNPEGLKALQQVFGDDIVNKFDGNIDHITTQLGSVKDTTGTLAESMKTNLNQYLDTYDTVSLALAGLSDKATAANNANIAFANGMNAVAQNADIASSSLIQFSDASIPKDDPAKYITEFNEELVKAGVNVLNLNQNGSELLANIPAEAFQNYVNAWEQLNNQIGASSGNVDKATGSINELKGVVTPDQLLQYQSYVTGINQAIADQSAATDKAAESTANNTNQQNAFNDAASQSKDTTQGISDILTNLSTADMSGLNDQMGTLIGNVAGFAGLNEQLANMATLMQQINTGANFDAAQKSFDDFVKSFEDSANTFRDDMTTLFGSASGGDSSSSDSGSGKGGNGKKDSGGKKKASGGGSSKKGSSDGETAGWFDGFVAQVEDMNTRTTAALQNMIAIWGEFQQEMLGVVGAGQDDTGGSGDASGISASADSVVGTLLVAATNIQNALKTWLGIMNNFDFGDQGFKYYCDAAVALAKSMADGIQTQCKIAEDALDALLEKAKKTASELASLNISGAFSGTANVEGSANASGTAYKDGSWGATESGPSLVGELGPEIVVSKNGRFRTVGDHGAEFTNIHSGDVIFNHRQTKELLSKGSINSRGRAYASGTVDGFNKTGLPNFFSKVQASIMGITTPLHTAPLQNSSLALALAGGSTVNKSVNNNNNGYTIENLNVSMPNFDGSNAETFIRDLKTITQKAIQKFT